MNSSSIDIPAHVSWSPDIWIAIFTGLLFVVTLVLAAATVLLVVLGRRQILMIREEAKQERTLAICHLYDLDPVLDAALRRLGQARDLGVLSYTSANRADATTILNYLDAIATGIAQKLYIEELARDHLEPIAKAHVEQYLSAAAPQLGINRANYKALLEMVKRWSEQPPEQLKTLFQSGH